MVQELLTTILRIPHDYPIGNFLDEPDIDLDMDEMIEAFGEEPYNEDNLDDLDVDETEEDGLDYGEDDCEDMEDEEADFEEYLRTVSEAEGSDGNEASQSSNETTEAISAPKEPTTRPPNPYRIRPITRIEALWRTLVGNTLPFTSLGFFTDPKKAVAYPAPDSLGYGFSNWITLCLLEMWYLYEDHACSDDDDHDGGKNGATLIEKSAAHRVLAAIAIWAAIHRREHFPLTTETIEFALPMANMDELAKLEEELDFVHGFYPSATWLKGLFDDGRPSESGLKFQGDPQAAVDGRWREQALMQFTEEERAEITAFERRMRTMMQGRRLFTTRSGLLGLGPRGLFGDKECFYEVHVIKGAKVPYVLANYGEGKYKLVGEAYVQGIMNGEVPERLGDEEWCKYVKIRLN